MSTTSMVASASASTQSASAQPASFKIIGLILAVMSGVFIGTSFVVKKMGLLRAQRRSGSVAGEGHAYLKDWLWWTGMTMMVVGEIFNFVAYAFTEAILVTPLGALSVVICAILSSIFLKETLTFIGWIGCALCIIGSVIIALNSPEQQSVTEIRPFMKLFIAPGFLVWSGVLISGALFGIFWLVPRYGKTQMLVHISICSLIGGLSVSCTQGLGASILTSIRGNNQVTFWFFWFLFVFVIVTLLVEINYLNKALELFNTSMVTPTYYVMFTFCTLATSIVLYQGLKASPIQIITIVMGFLVICGGITILQMSKVDPESVNKLERKSTMLINAPREEEEKITGLDQPGMDTMRPGFSTLGSIMRARSRRGSTATNRSRQASGFDPRDPFSLHNLPRYQLSDLPSGPNVRENSAHGSYSAAESRADDDILAPVRANTSIRFDPQDTIHQTGRAGHPEEAIHSHQMHPESPHVTGSPVVSLMSSGASAGHDVAGSASSRRGAPGFKQRDDSHLVAPPAEFGSRDRSSSAPAQTTSFGLTGSPIDLEPDRSRSVSRHAGLEALGFPEPRSASRDSHKDVSLGRKRDYPHLARKEERMPEYAEERRGLVGRSEDDSSSDSGKEDDLDDLFIPVTRK